MWNPCYTVDPVHLCGIYNSTVQVYVREHDQHREIGGIKTKTNI